MYSKVLLPDSGKPIMCEGAELGGVSLAFREEALEAIRDGEGSSESEDIAEDCRELGMS